MKKETDPLREGHTREWADRARVEMDPRQDVSKNASPRQSPTENNRSTRDESKDRDLDHDDKFY